MPEVWLLRTFDVKEYVNAAKLFVQYTALYNAGNADGKYTTKSWNQFVTIYKNAADYVTLSAAQFE